MSDTTPIILAVIGTGVTLLGIMAGLLVSLFRILRQDIKETNSRIDSLRQEIRADVAALHNRIDNLYQALFSHKDPAA